MIDTTSHQPLRVMNYGGTGGTIMVPTDILDKVKDLLNAHQVAYWVDEEALTVDDEPEVIFITLSRKCDPVAVQKILDSVP